MMDMTCDFTPFDLQTWPRRQLFHYFSAMAPTGYSLTVELDITEMLAALKTAGMKFFPAYLWVVTRVLNRQPEFKTAEVGSQLGYYGKLTPLYPVFRPDDHTFSLLWIEYDDCFRRFYLAYEDNARQYSGGHGVLAREDRLPPGNSYTISCVPWISFQHFAVHSYVNSPYYLPSVEAGKFFPRAGRIIMPLSITCHHAATDGYHVSRFLDEVQSAITSFAQFLP